MEEIILTEEEILELQRIEAIKQRELLIQSIKDDGYSGEGTLADFEKLMSKPVIFGQYWKRLAHENYELGLEKFIQLWQQYKDVI